MKSFSVLLLYPDYVSDDYGETYYWHGWGKDRNHALELAQLECRDNCSYDYDAHEDAAEVLVLEGHRFGV